jgi:small subunit ribosomal protein S18
MAYRRKSEDYGERSEGPIVRKKSRHLEGVSDIDPYDYELLRKFVTEHGKIMPSRLIGATAKQQRQIKRAVRRARVLGLLP